ncbi:ribulose-phosphate 3-epimerase [Candidatus Uhrbacteria bacterium]|nr:ribulose-phosphate 3-epimerase [Candidatus Uhrbacteria bacterium]
MAIPKIPATIKKHLSPALLAYSLKEVREKLAFIDREFPTAHLHIDVMDGKFVKAACYCAPLAFQKLAITHSFEVHLMVEHPMRHIAAWKKAGAKRAIFHIESLDDPIRVIKTIQAHHMEAGIALNPKTPLQRGRLIFPLVDAILLMGVEPGYAGQAFIQKVFRKLSALRWNTPNALIIVDGGVTRDNAVRLMSLGADQLVSTSMIYGTHSGSSKK